MAKKRKRTRRGQKPTQSDNGSGPRRLTKAERAKAAIDQAAELRERFEQAKRAQVAKAAIELDHVDAEILRLLLSFPGLTQEAIGDLVGLTRQTVNERINAPKFKRAIEIATRSALEIFESNKARAARVLGELLGSKDERIAVRAAIAHLWPHIHQGDKGTGSSDFVAFIQEAFELANAQKKPESEGGEGGAVGELDQTRTF